MPGCAHSVAAPAARSCARAANARWGSSYPAALALLYDADKAPTRELVGKGHTFNSFILSHQYQRNADGSYTDVGANPPVDTINGEKWLRSCRAVDNMLASGCEDFTGAGWTRRNAITVALVDGWYLLDNITAINDMYNTAYRTAIGTAGIPYSVSFDLKQHGASGVLSVQHPENKANGEWSIDLSKVSTGGERITDCHPSVTVLVPMVLGASGRGGALIERSSGPTTLSVYIRSPQITLLVYPVPYTPPGTTMPASNATITNGNWFTLTDGSPVWKALTGQTPGMTLATRVRMGVGSGDVPNSPFSAIGCSGNVPGQLLLYLSGGSPGRIPQSYDGVNGAYIDNSWTRNAIIQQIVQVNTAGTQFRVGYMIEGTHTTIQWCSWVAYDGSMNPSTLYRLMLGYNNPYPMWFNKIAVWNKQMDDAAILEALN